MWYMGVLVKLLGLLLFICFFAFSQVGEFNSLPGRNVHVRRHLETTFKRIF